MNKNQCRLRIAFGLLLLALCGVASAHAQRPRGAETSRPQEPGEERRRPRQPTDSETYDKSAIEQAIAQPFNSVLVRIRYKTEYGYKYESASGGPGLTSCDAFSVGLAKAARPAVPNVLIPVRRPEKITEEYGYYHCEFLISGLALDQDVTISASVEDQGPWLGTQSHLPSGYQRVLTDRERTVTLTQSEPRATMNFEMFYEPKREFMKTQAPSGSPLIRKP